MRVCMSMVLMLAAFSLSNKSHNCCRCMVSLYDFGQSSPPIVVSHTALTSCLGLGGSKRAVEV